LLANREFDIVEGELLLPLTFDMGKSFRKDSQHNKFSRRDRDSKEKFVKKFRKNNQPDPKVTEPVSADTKYPEND